MHDFEPPPRAGPARERARRRWRRLGVLSVAALLLHAAVLGGADWVWPAADRTPLPGAVQVRVIDAALASAGSVPVAPAVETGRPIASIPPTAVSALAPPLTVPAPLALPAQLTPPAPGDPAAPVPPRLAVTRARPVAAGGVPRATATGLAAAAPSAGPSPAAALVAAPSPTPAAVIAPTAADERPAPAPWQLALAATPAQAQAPAPAEATPPAGPDDEAIPPYRTRLPPAATLRYEVSRGMLRGTGELVWQPQADRYELKLDFRLSGLTILSQASSGGFDTAGIAPLRFTDQRLRRGTTAANFQREAEKISYSGSSKVFPLRAGAQDRLSWMLQLAAIVSAEPQLARPGGKVVMYVTGANGDAGVWVFRCTGPESVDARGGAIEAVKFMREPREPHDTTVQVWLDPKQHDLPVRAMQKSGENDEGFELRLLEVVVGPR